MVAMKQSELCMAEVLGAYDRLVEGLLSSSDFWDVVVLTTSDQAQQQVYELEIENKLKKKELPASPKYIVVHDPPGQKIGSGGSTMYTLSKIADLEPEWRSKKILLMHAGGSSQRLPSASVLGKAFTAIPIGNKVYTMFDVKLALLLPFAKRLPPGVFICCPDTFETFTFGNCEDISFTDRGGFLALAHPSPIDIGRGHGVYILEERDHTKDTELLSCSKVLQKPTERQMRDEGAVIKPRELCNISTSAASCLEYVFTDSNYFFDHSISDKLLEFYHQNEPISGEICAYGDFLQPLGCNATSDYIQNCKNVMFMSGNLIELRRKVYDLLKGSELNVLALKRSKFYHIGTLSEYIDSFCESTDLQSELGLSKFSFSASVGRDNSNKHGGSVGGCCIHSIVTDGCCFDDRSVVEYCKFDAGGVTVQENCIISNCVYEGSSQLTIPQNTFMQTVPVFDPKGQPMYVTLLYSVKDDLKAKVSSFSEATNLSYFQRSLMSIRPGVTSDELFGEGNPFTLWNAKLFPLSNTPRSSFLLALSYVNSFISTKKRPIIPEQACDVAALDSNGCMSNGHVSSQHMNGNCAVNGDSHKFINGEGSSSSQADVHSNNHVDKNSNESDARCKELNKHSSLYSFADIIKFKDAKRMIEERNCLSSLIKHAMSA